MKDNTKVTMHILTLPTFIRYFKVSTKDEEFFEETITKLADLSQIEHFVKNGINFGELIQEL